ncbi:MULTISPECIES: GAF domain-containing protein [unclassified Variovorax]|uniref:helix-turn-helix domain-containing protein n=1 Tax=unclassified Variovorax TaxID=663243 RepID=UPI0008C06155|nr:MULTISPECIES: GAF domain-containing protein [unclassified Variovorax]SEK17293.1 GAF domain-containing protein [Variovorax sp. OK202]SFE78087.1 GAF domain-containing protein [Variovorax sp. OK212]
MTTSESVARQGRATLGEQEAHTASLVPAELQSELLAMLQRNASAREFDDMLARVETTVHDPAQRSLLAGSIRAAVAVCEQQTLQQRRERGLLVVLESAHDLTSIRDLELVLQAIVRRARQIFSADIGYLTNFDRVRNDFYIRATEGAISERFKNVRVPPDHGICGHVLKHKTPYHSSDYLTDHGFAHEQGIDLAIKDEGVQSLLGAPLMVGNHCIGVLCICDRQPRRHAPWEVAMLSTLAAQAAVAIENARLFQEAQVALQRASDANASLHRQAEEIQTAAEAHEQMTRLVARGCSVVDILNMVASMLGVHIVRLDEAEQPTQHATVAPAHLAAHLAAHPAGDLAGDLTGLLALTEIQDQVHGALTEGRRSGRSHAVDGHPGRPELHLRVAALMGADRLLGAMVMLSDRAMSATEIRTFERGALVAGVVLLSQERSELVVSGESAAAIRALVSWQQESLAALQLRTQPLGLDLSLDPGLALRMAVLSVEDRHIEYALRRMRPAVAHGTLLEECEGFIVAICPEAAFEALQSAVQATLLPDARLGAIGVTSGTLTRVDALPDCFRALKRGIDILRALGRSHELLPEATLSMYSLLFEQRRATDVTGFIETTVGALVQHDLRRGTDLAGTLLAYLEHAQNAKATADALQIHVNTLRQRLEAIDNLLKDWRLGGRFLELHVALRMHMLRRKVHSQAPGGSAATGR